MADDTDSDRAKTAREQWKSLQQEFTGGLLYCHHRANTNTSKTLEVAAFAYGPIELLIEKGLLSETELNERKREVGKRLMEQLKDIGMGVMQHQSQTDKYTLENSVQIDCENRVHLCRAACCRLRFALSQQDLEEAIVKWNLAHPYLIARGSEGYCHHLEQGSCQCTVYQHRPLPCRAYDCRDDKRIWADFEQKNCQPRVGTVISDLRHHGGR